MAQYFPSKKASKRSEYVADVFIGDLAFVDNAGVAPVFDFKDAVPIHAAKRGRPVAAAAPISAKRVRKEDQLGSLVQPMQIVSKTTSPMESVPVPKMQSAPAVVMEKVQALSQALMQSASPAAGAEYVDRAQQPTDQADFKPDGVTPMAVSAKATSSHEDSPTMPSVDASTGKRKRASFVKDSRQPDNDEDDGFMNPVHDPTSSEDPSASDDEPDVATSEQNEASDGGYPSDESYGLEDGAFLHDPAYSDEASDDDNDDEVRSAAEEETDLITLDGYEDPTQNSSLQTASRPHTRGHRGRSPAARGHQSPQPRHQRGGGSRGTPRSTDRRSRGSRGSRHASPMPYRSNSPSNRGSRGEHKRGQSPHGHPRGKSPGRRYYDVDVDHTPRSAARYEHGADSRRGARARRTRSEPRRQQRAAPLEAFSSRDNVIALGSRVSAHTGSYRARSRSLDSKHGRSSSSRGARDHRPTRARGSSQGKHPRPARSDRGRGRSAKRGRR